MNGFRALYHKPERRAAAPRVSSPWPHFSVRGAPRVRWAAPRVESHAPRVQSHTPRVKSHTPRVQSHAPRVQSHTPRVQAHAPRVQLRTRLHGPSNEETASRNQTGLL